MILTIDSKGNVMLKKDLRAATKKRADEAEHKLKTRLSRGEKRTPRGWAVRVDGQPYQLGLLEAEIEKRNNAGTIIIDIIHGIEYLWVAARTFHPEASDEGEAKQAAAGMRRSATCKGLEERGGVDKCRLLTAI